MVSRFTSQTLRVLMEKVKPVYEEFAPYGIVGELVEEIRDVK